MDYGAEDVEQYLSLEFESGDIFSGYEIRMSGRCDPKESRINVRGMVGQQKVRPFHVFEALTSVVEHAADYGLPYSPDYLI